MTQVNELAAAIITFINNILVPLIFALAFLLFLWGVFKYFFAKANDPKARTDGGKFIFWGIIAFAVMISVWGLVRLVTGAFGFEGAELNRPCLPTFSGTCSDGTQPPTSPTSPTAPATGAPENILPDSWFGADDTTPAPGTGPAPSPEPDDPIFRGIY